MTRTTTNQNVFISSDIVNGPIHAVSVCIPANK